MSVDLELSMRLIEKLNSTLKELQAELGKQELLLEKGRWHLNQRQQLNEQDPPRLRDWDWG